MIGNKAIVPLDRKVFDCFLAHTSVRYKYRKIPGRCLRSLLFSENFDGILSSCNVRLKACFSTVFQELSRLCVCMTNFRRTLPETGTRSSPQYHLHQAKTLYEDNYHLENTAFASCIRHFYGLDTHTPFSIPACGWQLVHDC